MKLRKGYTKSDICFLHTVIKYMYIYTGNNNVP